jgi:hypothetical protein
MLWTFFILKGPGQDKNFDPTDSRGIEHTELLAMYDAAM